MLVTPAANHKFLGSLLDFTFESKRRDDESEHGRFLKTIKLVSLEKTIANDEVVVVALWENCTQQGGRNNRLFVF